MTPADNRPAPVEAERAWKRAIEEHAAELVRRAIGTERIGIVVGADSGGLVVDVMGPDGEWRSFYVRLTEVVR